MARYIDADVLTDKLEELQFNAPVMTPVMKIYNVIELVEDQPTADVVEVKHGYWIDNIQKFTSPAGVTKDYLVGYKCSECGRTESRKEPYCNCGAKMDLKERF